MLGDLGVRLGNYNTKIHNCTNLHSFHQTAECVLCSSKDYSLGRCDTVFCTSMSFGTCTGTRIDVRLILTYTNCLHFSQVVNIITECTVMNMLIRMDTCMINDVISGALPPIPEATHIDR